MLPSHAGPSLDGPVASVLIVTFVVFDAVHPEPFAVTVTVYMPVMSVVALVVKVGLCIDEPYTDGPLHA